MNIYEAFGRQAEQLLEHADAFVKTLELLRLLRDGKVLPSELVVEQTGWKLKEAEDNGGGETPDDTGTSA